MDSPSMALEDGNSPAKFDCRRTWRGITTNSYKTLPWDIWKFSMHVVVMAQNPQQLCLAEDWSKNPLQKAKNENVPSGKLTQGCPNDLLENQMMKPNFASHKQNQTNKWWQSAGFLFRTQIGLPLLTIEFLLVRSPKGALQRWRLGWSDKFPRGETLFAVYFCWVNYVLFASDWYQRE